MRSGETLGRWDRIGISVSGICLVHCLTLPIILATAPLWPMGDVLHAWLHPVFAVLLVPTTIFAGLHGWRHHQNRGILVHLMLGLIVVLAAGVLGHKAPGASTETITTITGSIILVSGHWRNWRSGAVCNVPHRDVPAAAQTEPVACHA